MKSRIKLPKDIEERLLKLGVTKSQVIPREKATVYIMILLSSIILNFIE